MFEPASEMIDWILPYLYCKVIKASVKLFVVQLKGNLCHTKPVCLQRTISTGSFLVVSSGKMIGQLVIGSMLTCANGCTVGSIRVSLKPTGEM